MITWVRKRGLLIAVLTVLLHRADAPAAGQQVDWQRIAETTEFAPRDSCGELVLNDRMWLLGGWLSSYEDPPRDVWSSPDGKQWTRAAESAPWKHSDFAMTLAFRDRMWVMGGWHGGRLAHASASSQVWSSTEGHDWTQQTASAGWSPRMASGAVVFKDRMWILGGVQKYYFGTDDDLLSDVWCSEDGVHWECKTERAPWTPRAYHVAVAFRDRLWVLGGGNYLPNYQAHNDVWSSADGVNWTQETEAAGWPPRIWFSACTYRDHLWVLGGWSNNPAQNWNDVWYSADGKQWHALKTPTIWKPRHEHSAYVFQDKLWVVGGHAAPLTNDVWQLDLPENWPASP